MRPATAACFLFLASCAGAPTPAGDGTLPDLAWLAGDWQGSQGTGWSQERWSEARGGTMFAFARFLADGRTAFFEYLRIESRGDEVFYVAQPLGRPAVEFKRTHQGPREVVFENPQHDHPVRIAYALEDDGTLVAQVEGKGGANREEFRLRRSDR